MKSKGEMSEEANTKREDVVKEEPKKEEVVKEEPKKEEPKKLSPKDIHFDSILTSKIGSLMPETTEVVDVDDVLSYKDNFTLSDKSRLVPFVIYMDAQFRQVVKTKRRNAMLFLLVKLLGVTVLVAGVVYAGSTFMSK